MVITAVKTVLDVGIGGSSPVEQELGGFLEYLLCAGLCLLVECSSISPPGVARLIYY